MSWHLKARQYGNALECHYILAYCVHSKCSVEVSASTKDALPKLSESLKSSNVCLIRGLILEMDFCQIILRKKDVRKWSAELCKGTLMCIMLARK